MLSKSEEKLINLNVRDYYHVISCNTHLFGEPFLEGGYLYYFDGEIVTLITPMIKGEITSKNLNATVASVIKKRLPQNLIIWGETPTTDIHKQKEYKLHKKDIELWKREIVFKTSNFIPSKKYNQYLRKAASEGLSLKHVKLPYYKADYTKLLMQTHQNLLGLQSLSYYSIFPNVEEANFVEVLKDGKLISVNVIIEVLPNYVCFAEVGYDKSFNRASGLSKAMLFEYYLGKATYISWGGCSNEGIYKYKRELLGKTPVCFYNNFIWDEFYKKEKSKWWLTKMQKSDR